MENFIYANHRLLFEKQNQSYLAAFTIKKSVFSRTKVCDQQM